MNNDPLHFFEFKEIDHQADKTLFLLHGTGGSKNDFLFLDQLLNKKYNLVGLQGNINEDGMTRFFRRFSSGVFDQENITEETTKFSVFIEAWMKEKSLNSDQTSFLGYSNGANMILATLLRFPELIKNAILLHPMLPFSVEANSLDLSNHSLLITHGLHDQMINENDYKAVKETLTSLYAKPILHQYHSGHEVTQQELKDVVRFLLN